jgi:predicted enzyme related to lactoylglutathione lyase
MWRNNEYPDLTGRTEFALFKEDNNYFSPSPQKVMLNFRVNNLNKLIEKLQKDGVQLVGEPETFDYGKFAWLLDPDDRKIELWEPVDEVLDNYDNQQNK